MHPALSSLIYNYVKTVDILAFNYHWLLCVLVGKAKNTMKITTEVQTTLTGKCDLKNCPAKLSFLL